MIDSRQAAVKAVLTHVQFVTWLMAENGASHRAIAEVRGVSKGTVDDCLRDVDRKLKEAGLGAD